MKNDIQLALNQFDDIIKRFELSFYEWFEYNLELPDELNSFLLFNEETATPLTCLILFLDVVS